LRRLASSWAEINAIGIEDCDLLGLPMLRARLTVEAPDVIINAAAYNAGDIAESGEACARVVNADAVEAMAEAGGRVVHVSSDLVFDGCLPRA
jgi:dTDP-4-dehydrorhamnose reductase